MGWCFRTHQTHCVQTIGREKLMVADTSDSTEFRIVRTQKVAEEQECDENDDSEVNVMHRSGNGWKWPTNPDSITIIRTLLDLLIHRKAAGNRGQFVFDDIV